MRIHGVRITGGGPTHGPGIGSGGDTQQQRNAPSRQRDFFMCEAPFFGAVILAPMRRPSSGRQNGGWLRTSVAAPHRRLRFVRRHSIFSLSVSTALTTLAGRLYNLK